MAAQKNTTTLHFAPKLHSKTDPAKGAIEGQPKETKGTVVYDECNEDGSKKEFGVAIGQLYVTKEFLKANRPKLLTMTLTF